jgi:hypothetical protein
MKHEKTAFLGLLLPSSIFLKRGHEAKWKGDETIINLRKL